MEEGIGSEVGKVARGPPILVLHAAKSTLQTVLASDEAASSMIGSGTTMSTSSFPQLAIPTKGIVMLALGLVHGVSRLMDAKILEIGPGSSQRLNSGGYQSIIAPETGHAL